MCLSEVDNDLHSPIFLSQSNLLLGIQMKVAKITRTKIINTRPAVKNFCQTQLSVCKCVRVCVCECACVAKVCVRAKSKIRISVRTVRMANHNKRQQKKNNTKKQKKINKNIEKTTRTTTNAGLQHKHGKPKIHSEEAFVKVMENLTTKRSQAKCLINLH